MRDRDFLQDIDVQMEQLRKGAFLTVKGGGSVNTMTIGWATIGIVWRTEIFMVAVRDSRHTFSVIEKADDFTVTIPLDDRFKQFFDDGCFVELSADTAEHVRRHVASGNVGAHAVPKQGKAGFFIVFPFRAFQFREFFRSVEFFDVAD